MTRNWVRLQLLIGWLPVYALYVTLILTAHPGTGLHWAIFGGLVAIVSAALLGLLAQRVIDRLPWPRPVRVGFVAAHALAALAYAFLWLVLNSLLITLLARGGHVLSGHFIVVAPAGLGPFLILGVWMYVMVAAVSYATRATERAARAEATLARSRLAVLRSQLNPHFLFNALHTVVHLIPDQPDRAAQAAEQIAALLRTGIEEDRDLIPLSEEWAFVERYLELERIRFGDRLQVRVDLAEDARDAEVPSFALQTLVENAVRHGAAPRVEQTEIAVTATATPAELTLTVRDTGAGVAAATQPGGEGTGLDRLRERLAVLYGGRGRLDLTPGAAGGFTASLRIPRQPV